MSDVAGRLRALADADPMTGPRILTLPQQDAMLRGYADALDALRQIAGTATNLDAPARRDRDTMRQIANEALAEADRLLGDNT